MNAITFLPEYLSESLVVALLHFLWQGALIAIGALFLSVTLLRRRSPETRYAFFVSMLLAMAMCIPVTLLWTIRDGGIDGENSATAAPSMPISIANSSMKDGATGFPVDTSSEDASLEFPAAALTAPEGIESEAGLIEQDTPATDGAFASPEPAFAPATPATAPAPWATVDWRPYAHLATLLYFFGVLLMSARLILALQGGRALRRNSVELDDKSILAYLDKIASELAIATAPFVAYSHAVAVPTVVGVLKPAILLPLTIGTGFTPEQIELVLAHELAHIKRHDHIVNLFQRVIEALLFFHPAVWYVSRQIALEREHCCDDLVLKTGGKPAAYAASLVRAAELSGNIAVNPISLAATGAPSQLQRRIRRLLGEPATPLKLVRPGVAATVCIASLILVTAATMARTEPQKEMSLPENLALTLPGTEDSAAEAETEEPIAHEQGAESPSPRAPAETTADWASMTVAQRSEAESDEELLRFQEESIRAMQRLRHPILIDSPDPNPEQERLIRQLHESDSWINRVALRQMGESGDTFYARHLIAYLQQDGNRNEIETVTALGTLADPLAIQYLVSELGPANNELREAIVVALKRFDPPKVVDFLDMALNDTVRGRRQYNAAYALGEIATPKAVEILHETLWQVDLAPAVLNALWKADRERLLPLLEETILGEDLERALLAARVISWQDDEAVSDLQAELRAHSEPSIRALAIDGMHSRDDRDSIPLIEQALLDPNYEVARTAATTLEKWGHTPQDPEHRAAYYVFTGASEIAGTLGDHALAPLIVALQTTNDNRLSDFLIVLGGMKDDSTIPHIAQFYSHKNIGIQNAAITAMGAVGSPKAAISICETLANPNAGLRRYALQLLYKLDHPFSEEPVRRLLDDLSSNVRAAAIRLLGTLESDETALILAKLQDEDSRVRGAAIEVLGQKKVRDAVPALLQLLKRDEQVTEVLQALVSIGDESAVEEIREFRDDWSERIEGGLRSKEAGERYVKNAEWALRKLSRNIAPPKEETALATSDLVVVYKDDRGEAVERRLTELFEQIDDADWWLRKVAAQQLGGPQDTEYRSAVVTTLILSLKDEDPRVAAAAAESLGKHKDPKAIKHLVATLKDEDNQARGAALNALLQFDEADTLSLLSLAIRDDDRQMKLGAATILMQMKSSEALNTLLSVLTFTDGSIRNKVAEHLGNAEPWSDVKPLLHQLLESDNERARFGALHALAVHGGEENRAILFERARHGPTRDRSMALALLKDDDDKAVTTLFIDLLQDDDFDIRSNAARGLTSRNYLPNSREDLARYYVALEAWPQVQALGTAALDPLLDALASPQLKSASNRRGGGQSARVWVIGLLGEIKAEKAVDPLIDQLNHENKNIRTRTLQALAKIGDVRSIQACLDSLDDAHDEVRRTAVKSLATFDGDPMIDGLIKALRDVDPRVRKEAATQLAEKAHPRAAKPLAETTLDVDNGVRGQAIYALGKIGHEAFPALDAIYDQIPETLHGKVIMGALIHMGPIAIGRLIDALHSDDESTSITAAQALERFDTPEVVKALVQVVEHESTDPGVKKESIITLGRLKAQEAVDLLLRELEREDTELPNREIAAVALTLIGDPRTLAALEAFRAKNYPQGRMMPTRLGTPGGSGTRLVPVDPNNYEQFIKGLEKMQP